MSKKLTIIGAPTTNKVIQYNIEYRYTYKGDEFTDTITMNRDEIERVGNARQGVQSRLEAGWIGLGDDRFRDLALVTAMRLHTEPLAVTTDGKVLPKEKPPLEPPIVLLPSSAIQEVIITPLFQGEKA